MRELPEELKVDKYGCFYMDDVLAYKSYICFSDYIERNGFRCKSSFSRIKSTNDYIIKRSIISLSRRERNEILVMLRVFREIASRLPKIDLPIGYHKEGRHLDGTIIPYYESSPSIKNIMDNYSLEKYRIIYNHSDDVISNLFSSLNDILNIIESLFDNNVFYFDINYGNFLVSQNEMKIIDFEPNHMSFTKDKYTFSILVVNFLRLVHEVLENYHLPIYNLSNLPYCKESKEYPLKEKVLDYANGIGYQFDDVKKYLKTLENNVSDSYRK